MDYYEKRARATRQVDSLLSKGLPIPVITAQIERDYGFNLRFVKKRVETLSQAQEVLKDVPKREINSQTELPRKKTSGKSRKRK